MYVLFVALPTWTVELAETHDIDARARVGRTNFSTVLVPRVLEAFCNYIGQYKETGIKSRDYLQEGGVVPSKTGADNRAYRRIGKR